MKSFGIKLRLIFYPFLLCAAGFMLVYSCLNCWLTMQTAAVSLKEDITDLWAPLLAPFIVLAIWMRPRIRLLNLRTKKDNNLPLLYLLIGGLVIGSTAVFLQGYLRIAMGKLTPLTSISEIRKNKPTKYYSVKNYYVDTSFIAFDNIATISGKNNQYRNFSIYIVCPIFDKQVVIAPPGENVKIGIDAAGPLPDSVKSETKSDSAGESAKPADLPQAWACTHYKEQISNRLAADERTAAWKEFFKNSLEDFHSKDPNRLVYLDRIGNTEDRAYYEKAIIHNPYITSIPAPLFILEPRLSAFEARTGNKLGYTFGGFGIGVLVWIIMLAIPPLDASKLKGFNQAAENRREGVQDSSKKTGSKEWKEGLSLLLPRPGYTAIPIIIDLNLLVFMAMVVAGKGFIDFESPDLLAWGANYRPLTAGAHQWWRLLMSTFLHAGVMHLLFNMVGLLFAGVLLEPALGKGRVAAVYLLTGIVASLVSMCWHPATVSVGASGAIFGLYGVFLALLTTHYFPAVFKKSFTIGVLVFVGGNLVAGLAGGIDNAAHIGGLLSGIVAGYVLYPQLKREKEMEQVGG